MIVTTKKLFELAYGKYAIGAYNINNLEQTMGLFRGCMDSQAPFIIQISKGARSYTHKLMLEGMIRTADEIFPDAIFAVHLDHGDEKTCYRLHRERLLQLGHDRRQPRAVREEHRDHQARGRRGARQGHRRRGRAGPAGRRRGARRR